ncbi:hypothetical protein BH10ACT2_BH10ACT2_21620 [soil metagenome]
MTSRSATSRSATSRSAKRLSLPVLIGTPLLLLFGGGAIGWFTADDSGNASTPNGSGEPLPAIFDAVAPLHPLIDAPNPLDNDESMVIGASELLDAPDTIEVAAGAALEVPVDAGNGASAVDPATLLPATVGAPTPIALGTATAIDPPTAPTAPTPSPTGIVRAAIAPSAVATPTELRISAPFAAVGIFAELCNEVEAGNVPDPELLPATRPTLAVLANQPSTMAISGTWADGTTLEKTTMVTLPAHDVEWHRRFDETGEQATIVACLTLPIDDVRSRDVDGVARLRASILAISATGQADLNATVALNVSATNASSLNDSLFVDEVTLTGRGEQRRADGVLYPTMHVHYAFLADAVIPVGSALQPGQLRVLSEHAFVEGADCAGWAANHQGVDRTHSGRFNVRTAPRKVAGHDRPVTVVDGDVYLDPTLPGGWEGSFCVRLQATDQHGDRRSTVALSGAQVRDPRTATYEVGVLLDGAATPGASTPVGGQVDASWTSASGTGCAPTTLLEGLGAQCSFSARLAADGIVVRLTSNGNSAEFRVPVNTGYCNPDDPLDSGDGCSTGFTQTFDVLLGTSMHVTLQVVRTASPGVLWDDPSNQWSVGPTT